MLSIDARINGIRGWAQDVKERSQQKNAKMVSIRDEIFEKLKASALSYKARYHCAQVGVNPRNRSFSMIEPQELPKKLKKFKMGGWSWIECKGASCTERIPGKKGNKYEDENKLVAKKSNGQIAPVDTDSLRTFSITCGHTNQSLRCVHWRLPCDDPELGCDGRYSAERFSDEPFHVALETGMEWTVIKWQVEDAFPDLIDLLIEADNVPQAVARADNTIEKLLKIHHNAKTIADEDGNVDWEKVETMAERSTLDNQHEIKEYVAFVKSSAGSLDDPTIIKEADAYSKILTKVRDIPAAVLGRFDGVDLGPAGSPLWRAACLKIQLSSEKATEHNVSKYFNPIDITNMSRGLRTIVLNANEIMEKSRAILKKADIPESLMSASQLAEVNGRLDVRLVAHVMKRPVLGTFASLSEIGSAWHADVAMLIKGSNVSLPACPWGKVRADEPGASGASRMDTLVSSSGLSLSHVVAHFTNKGIVVGTLVKTTDSQVVWKVLSIKKLTVELEEQPNNELTNAKAKSSPKKPHVEVSVNEFLGKFTVSINVAKELFLVGNG